MKALLTRKTVQRPLVLSMSTLVLLSTPAWATQNTTTQYAYDNEGNLTQITDPLSNVTTLTVDALNRVTNVLQPAASTGGTQPSTTTAYDGHDQVTSVTDPLGNATTYTVDGLGDVTQVASPDTGTTTRTYDAAGNLSTRTDARSQVSTYSYDALNRVTQISYTSGTSTAFQYDGGGSPLPNDIGHLTLIADESGSTRLQYDAFGHVIQKTQITDSGSGGVTQIVQYGYGTSGASEGLLTTLTYPSGAVANYSYDSTGRVSGVTVTLQTDSGSTTTGLLSSLTYNPFGAPTGWTWGNSATYSRSYDLDGRMAQYPLGVLSGTVTPGALTRTVNYDASSRATSYAHADSTGSTTSSTATAANESFDYDNLDRLTTYTPSTTVQSYTYDLNGNRTGLTVGSTPYTDSLTTGSNQLASTTGPSPAKSNTYDAAGNLTTDGTISYTYSARGRMASSAVSGNTVDYLYNGLGQRVLKSGPSGVVSTGVQRYVYDEAGHLLGEYDTDGNVVEETVWLGEMPIGVLTPSGVVVDNADANVSSTGTWSTATSETGYYATNYASHTASSGSDILTWNVTVGSAGSYDVYARWPAAGGNSTNAAYTIGTSTVYEDQTSNGNQWNYLGTYTLSAGANSVVLSTDPSGTVIADAVEAVPASSPNLALSYIYADHLNAPRLVIQPATNERLWNNVMADPFSNTVPDDNPDGLGVFVYNPGFPGQLYDQETGLNYNYYRNYDPQSGGYLESDPLGLYGNSYSTYAYVGGNPISRIDPYGLAWQVVVGGGVTAITPFFGGGLSFNVGLNIDGWNSSLYIQDQGNIGLGTGAYIGTGLSLTVTNTDAPTTGFDAAPYLEADAAYIIGGGVSATQNSCGNVDVGGSKGFQINGGKGQYGLGAGAFVGYTGTATAVSPTLNSLINALGSIF